MKKYNRFNFKFVLIGLIIPIALFILAYGSVFAYFTATTSKSKPLTMGNVRIGFTDELSGEIKIAETKADLTTILPGTNYVVSGSVENIGMSKIYAILELTITVKKQNAESEETLTKKYYTADGNEIAIASNVASTPATVMDVSDKVSFSFKTEFDFWHFDNSYQGAKINLSVKARALQFVNIEAGEYASAGVQATNILLEGLI